MMPAKFIQCNRRLFQHNWPLADMAPSAADVSFRGTPDLARQAYEVHF
jgi:hypothetical protein